MEALITAHVRPVKGPYTSRTAPAALCTAQPRLEEAMPFLEVMPVLVTSWTEDYADYRYGAVGSGQMNRLLEPGAKDSVSGYRPICR